MATKTDLQNPCQGRYIAYSKDLDTIFLENQQKIDFFKEKKLQELLAENPFNLSNPSGIKLAQGKICEEVGSEISEISSGIFRSMRMDIASSVLVSYVSKKA